MAIPTAERPAARVATRASARERLLTAADELFYQDGLFAVGIDRVIEHAGVAKASLYNAFGSKEELIRAYLAQRLERRQERITRALERYTTPRARLLGVFDALGELIAQPSFRGCAFLRASAEVSQDGATATVCAASRAWSRTLFTGLAQAAGARDPAGLARQLVLLYDGAVVAAQMDRDTQAAQTARAVAEVLVDAAI